MRHCGGEGWYDMVQSILAALAHAAHLRQYSYSLLQHIVASNNNQIGMQWSERMDAHRVTLVGALQTN